MDRPKKVARAEPPSPAFNPALAALSEIRPRLAPRRPKAEAGAAPAPPSAPPAGEEDIFRAEMADVTPLARPSGRHLKESPPPKAWPAPRWPDEELEVLRTLTDLVSGRAEFDLAQTAEYAEGWTRGLPPTLMDHLRAGRIPFQDHLDLHGLTLTQSEAAVTGFILAAVARGCHCVLLVHGRGLGSPDGVPVLKHNLENLLLHGPVRKYIQAFTTARPVDGGLGASYVLLRS